LPDCTASFNSNKEGTNEKSSIASEEYDALFASKGRRRPRTDLVGQWAPELARLSLPCRRPINQSFTASGFQSPPAAPAAAAAAATSDLCSSASDSDTERPMKQAMCCISMHVSTQDYSNSATWAWTESTGCPLLA